MRNPIYVSVEDGVVDEHPGVRLKMRQHGALVAYGAFYVLDGLLWVFNVDVPNEFRRQGFGKALYLAAYQVAKNRGLEGLASDASARSAEATRVWNALKRDGALVEQSPFASSMTDVPRKLLRAIVL